MLIEAVGLAETVRERLVGGTAERFVKRFWPDFPAGVPARRR